MKRTQHLFFAAVVFCALLVSSITPTSRPAVAQDTEPIVIEQWYHQYGEEGTQEAALRYAEEYSAANPNVQVNVSWIPGDYSTRLNAALLAGEGPDVYEIGGPPTYDQINAGQFAPLNDIFTEEDMADFNERNLEVMTVNDTIYGIKMIDDTQFIYYRKSMLEAAGIAPASIETVDDLIAAAEQLNTGRVKGLFVGNDGRGPLTELIIWSAGSDFIVDNQIAFGNERTVAAIEKLRELSQSEALLLGAPTDWWDPSAFIQGLTAMQWSGLWAMPQIQHELGDDFGIIPFPALDSEGTPVAPWGGWFQVVNANSDNVEEAKEFARSLWLENLEAQQDWNLAYGFHVPPRISAAANADVLSEGAPADAVSILSNYGRYQSPLYAGAVTTPLSDAITNILVNGADAETEIMAAAEQAQAELDILIEELGLEVE